MHKRLTILPLLVSAGLLIGACVPAEYVPTGPITIELVNDTQLDVEPRFFASATTTKDWHLFDAENLVTDFTDRAFPELRPRESATLSYPCEELASFGVHNPAMIDAIAIERTVAKNTLFFVVGEDVPCEATVRFTYYVENGEFLVRTSIE